MSTKKIDISPKLSLEDLLARRGFRYNFWTGARELIEGAVRGALKAASGELPFELTNCPLTVEAVMMPQRDKRRLILQLLNHEDQSAPVSGLHVKVRRPSTDGVKVFYPTDGEQIRPEIGAETVGFVVRDFKVHEAVVIER